MISKSFSNSTYLTFPVLAFSACLFHGRFMHDIGYVFWRALHFFAGFEVCHSFNHLKNLHTAFILCVFFAPPNLNRGKGKRGFFPRGVAITVPYLILSRARKKNQLPKINFIYVCLDFFIYILAFLTGDKNFFYPVNIIAINLSAVPFYIPRWKCRAARRTACIRP